MFPPYNLDRKTPFILACGFHRKYNLPINGSLTLAEIDTCIRLLQEETQEAVQALQALRYIVETDTWGPDAVQVKANVLKELCDVGYVAPRAAVSFGWDYDGAMTAVHKSNMTKDGSLDGGKITKGPSYCPADIKKFIIC